MGLYVSNITSDSQVVTDVKVLVPDAGVRRRMSRVIRMAVSTAVECVGGIEGIDGLDAIITATGYGCLADSERFLRNVISDKEDLLNPTPFIQSTFNTVGGQIALLRHNHCYNMTYVNRIHSFEDALLDAFMRAEDGEGGRMLVGAFDERTDSQYEIMKRMGLWRKHDCGEGSVFVLLTSQKEDSSIAEVLEIDFPSDSIGEQDIAQRYGCSDDDVILYNVCSTMEIYPTISASVFAQAVEKIKKGASKVLVYNEMWGMTPTVVILGCIV